MQKWDRKITIEKYISSLKVGLSINKSMKISSIGSCFAREIKQYLLKNKFNYLLVEQNKNPWIKMDANFKPTDHGSAAWDRVFNTFTLKYIVQAAFGVEHSRLLQTDKGVADILRTRIMYPDMESAIRDVGDHNKQSRYIFETADVLIATLGLTEIWKWGGIVLPYKPEYIKTLELKFYNTGVDVNYKNLLDAWKLLKKHNPKLKLLVTLSPIHMNSSFRNDIDVYSASCASKSILRTAIESFIQEKDVYYFPSYEITTILCPELRVKQYCDGHHISREAFNIIEKTFESLVKV